MKSVWGAGLEASLAGEPHVASVARQVVLEPWRRRHTLGVPHSAVYVDRGYSSVDATVADTPVDAAVHAQGHASIKAAVRRLGDLRKRIGRASLSQLNTQNHSDQSDHPPN